MRLCILLLLIAAPPEVEAADAVDAAIARVQVEAVVSEGEWRLYTTVGDEVLDGRSTGRRCVWWRHTVRDAWAYGVQADGKWLGIWYIEDGRRWWVDDPRRVRERALAAYDAQAKALGVPESEAAIDRRYIEKHYLELCPGSCGMLCGNPAHGTHWEQRTIREPAPQTQQPTYQQPSYQPQMSGPSGGCGT